MIRLLAIDLDGTLFGEDLVIRPTVRAALAAARDKGVIVTLATGRMFRSTLPHAQDLGLTAPLICYQGALVRDPATGATLFHRPLAQATALEAIALLATQGWQPNVYLDDNLYVAERNAGTDFYARLSSGIPVNAVGDLSAFVRAHGGDPTKLAVVLPDEATAGATVRLLQEHFGDRVYATKSHPLFAEAINPTCDKGVALGALAAHLGIAQSETMAVGDGSNDIPMLRWAGTGVAMGQAAPAVRTAATYVTLPLAEGGLTAAIERFIL